MNKKRMNYIFIIVEIILSFIFTTKVNAETIYLEGVVTKSDVANAFLSKTYDTVVLNKDVIFNSCYSTSTILPIEAGIGKTKTIDLNGHTFQMGPDYCEIYISALSNDNKINIIDSSEEQTGVFRNKLVIRNCRNNINPETCYNLELNINGGTYTSRNFLQFAVPDALDIASGYETYYAKNVNLNISNVKITGELLFENYSRNVKFSNSILMPTTSMILTNYEEQLLLSDIIPSGNKVLNKYGTMSLNTNISKMNLEETNLYVVKDTDIVSMQNFENKNLNYNVESLKLKLVNPTEESIEIKSIIIDNTDEFELQGSGNIILPPNDSVETDYLISNKSGLKVGMYNTNIILKDSNGNLYADTINFEVENISISKPKLSSELLFDYDGNEHEVTFSNFDSTAMEISGNKATEVGDYSVYISLKEGYCWNDGTTDDIVYNWTIRQVDEIENIKIIGSSFLNVNKSSLLSVIITPNDATYKEVTWSVENGTGAATIDQNGLLTATQTGTVKVIVTANYNNSIYAEKDIIINSENSVERIMISAPSYYLSSDSTYKLSASVYPTNIENKEVIWSSLDTTVATIDQNGILTPKKQGQVSVRATSKDGSNVYEEIELFIYNDDGDTIIGALDDSLKIEFYSTTKYTYSTLKWIFSDRTIFDSVYGGGTEFSEYPYKYYLFSLKPIKAGYSSITLNHPTSDFTFGTKYVYTYNPIKSLSSNYDEIILEKNDILILDIPSWLEEISDESNGIYFTVEDSTIANIDSNGRIKAIKNGNTNVIAFSKFNNQKVIIPLSVVDDKNNYFILSESITISGETKDLRVGRTFQYEASFKPTNTTNKEVTWSVENGIGVATIDQNGLLTATKSGTVTVKATSKDGTNIVGTLEVTLMDYVDVESIFIKTKDLYVNTGTSMYMSAIIYPANSTNKKVRWTSSDTSIATIDPDTGGLATNYKTGVVTIKATATDGSGVVGSIQLHVGYTSVKNNEITSLGNASYVTYEDVIWEIADTTIAQPTGQTGKTCITVGGTVKCKHSINVKGLKNGNTTVTMKTISGSTLATSTVYVYTPISNLSSDFTELNLTKNEEKKINITIAPDNVSSGLEKLIYTSSDETVVRVDKEGNVTALKNGNANIIVYSQYNDISIIIPVTVATYSESLNVDTNNLTLNDENRTHQIIYEVLPEDAINKNVTFESSNTSVVTVSNTGLVTAVRNGTATITVRTEDGRQKKIVSVTVSGLRKEIQSLNYQSIGDVVYNGSAHIPDIVIKDGGYTLIKNTDYTVLYDKNTNYGIADVNIEGIGNYKGTKTIHFNINKANINVTDNSKNVTVTYDGNEHSIEVNLDYGSNVNVKYMNSNNEYVLDQVPKYTEVGTYITKYKVYIDNNYTEYYGQKTLTIEDAITYTINNYDVDETNKYINKIMVNTELNSYTANFTLGHGYGIDVDSKVVNGKNVLYTGSETRITKGLNLYAKYTNVVIGDINGDGAINSADLLKIRQHLLKTNILSGAYFLSSDINYDNTINSADLLRVRQHLLGTKQIG